MRVNIIVKIVWQSSTNKSISIWNPLLISTAYNRFWYSFSALVSHCLNDVLISLQFSSQTETLRTWKHQLISSYKLLFPLEVVSGLKSMLYTHWGLFNKGWTLFAHAICDLFFWHSKYFLNKKRLASVTFEGCKKSSIWNHEHEHCTM